MKHPFTHRRAAHQLVKHPVVATGLKRGDITSAEASALPWHFRMTTGGKRRLRSTGTADTAEAVRIARGWLDAGSGCLDTPLAGPARPTASGATIGELAAAWQAAGMPDDSGAPRTLAQRAGLEPFLAAALRWWGGRAVSAVRPVHLREYADHRRATCTRGTGERSIDLELLALSHLCRWAESRELCGANPFARRPRFRKPASVRHAHEHTPASTEELHAVLGALMASENPQRVVAGAHLCCCFLTGLRPGEPSCLARVDIVDDCNVHRPGELYTAGDPPRRFWAVGRLKRGQNPAVEVHPALTEYLTAWVGWLEANIKGRFWWFPNPDFPDRPLVPWGARISDSCLGGFLRSAARKVGAKGHLTPHGMRAAYVRVRRSQGADDLTISIELGQGSGPGLIRNVYGDPAGIVGDGAFDWVPANQPPCWETLSQKGKP